jgi:hypothetical protein
MEEMVPPINGSLFCVGHSFSENCQPFIPIMSVQPSNKVNFKPCAVGDSVYQTVEFVNQTDTPSFFKFNIELDPQVKVFPQTGVVEAKSFCIIVLEFTPVKDGYFHKVLNVSLNHSQSNLVHVHCYGYLSITI